MDNLLVTIPTLVQSFQSVVNSTTVVVTVSVLNLAGSGANVNIVLPFQQTAQKIMTHVDFVFAQLVNLGAQLKNNALLFQAVVLIMTDAETVNLLKLELPGALLKRNVTTSQPVVKNTTIAENALATMAFSFAQQLMSVFKNHSVVSETQIFAEIVSLQTFLLTDGASLLRPATQSTLTALLWITDVEFVSVKLDLPGALLKNFAFKMLIAQLEQPTSDVVNVNAQTINNTVLNKINASLSYHAGNYLTHVESQSSKLVSKFALLLVLVIKFQLAQVVKKFAVFVTAMLLKFGALLKTNALIFHLAVSLTTVVDLALEPLNQTLFSSVESATTKSTFQTV